MAGGGMHGRGGHGRGGHGRVHVWWGICLAGRYAWLGACMAGDVHGRGTCMAEGTCMAGRGVRATADTTAYGQ